ncbi:hypothetical protein ACJMK2_019129 [Sinanodonta woodiana]|uniref:C1q domain-containing protein n=1 Tax=Sinanodonta woodiana TaxID=1069815 RepID=A0ABD3UIW3_SINWO
MDWSWFVLLIFSSTDFCSVQTYNVVSTSERDNSLDLVIIALQERLAILEVAFASSDVNDQLTDLKREVHDVKQENERLQQRLLRQEETLEQLQLNNQKLCLQNLSPHSVPNTYQDKVQPPTPQNIEDIVSVDNNVSDDRIAIDDGKPSSLSSSVRSVSEQTDSSVRSHLVKKQVQDGQVAFHAKVSLFDLENLGMHHTIIFDSVVTNIGAGYHAHTGIFIAPVHGLYVFHVTAMSSPRKDQFLELVKDGNVIQYVYPDADGATDFMSASMTVPLEVEKGGEVWVRTSGGMGTIHGNYATFFTGFLIHSM